MYSALIQEKMKTVTHVKEEQGEIMGLAVQTGTRTKGQGGAGAGDKMTICIECATEQVLV